VPRAGATRRDTVKGTACCERRRRREDRGKQTPAHESRADQADKITEDKLPAAGSRERSGRETMRCAPPTVSSSLAGGSHQAVASPRSGGQSRHRVGVDRRLLVWGSSEATQVSSSVRTPSAPQERPALLSQRSVLVWTLCAHVGRADSFSVVLALPHRIPPEPIFFFIADPPNMDRGLVTSSSFWHEICVCDDRDRTTRLRTP